MEKSVVGEEGVEDGQRRKAVLEEKGQGIVFYHARKKVSKLTSLEGQLPTFSILFS